MIRLFANVDWSQLTGELRIPDGYVLAGQGYNITLGQGGVLDCDKRADLHQS